MRNAVLDEAKAGIKITRKNINNFRYTGDTTLMAESEELKSLLMKVKEKSEKGGLNLNIQKTKIMASGPMTSLEIDGETVETVADFNFFGSKITAHGDCSHKIKRHLLLGIGWNDQHHSSKASIIWCSVFFTVQLSHPYMTIGKTLKSPLDCKEIKKVNPKGNQS